MFMETSHRLKCSCCRCGSFRDMHSALLYDVNVEPTTARLLAVDARLRGLCCCRCLRQSLQSLSTPLCFNEICPLAQHHQATCSDAACLLRAVALQDMGKILQPNSPCSCVPCDRCRCRFCASSHFYKRNGSDMGVLQQQKLH